MWHIYFPTRETITNFIFKEHRNIKCSQFLYTCVIWTLAFLCLLHFLKFLKYGNIINIAFKIEFYFPSGQNMNHFLTGKPNVRKFVLILPGSHLSNLYDVMCEKVEMHNRMLKK